MPDIPRLLTSAQVAEALGISLPHFYRVAPQLRADRAFPRPVLGRLYDPGAIADWLARQRIEALPFPPADRREGEGAPPPPENIPAGQAELDRRLAGLAREGRAA